MVIARAIIILYYIVSIYCTVLYCTASPHPLTTHVSKIQKYFFFFFFLLSSTHLRRSVSNGTNPAGQQGERGVVRGISFAGTMIEEGKGFFFLQDLFYIQYRIG